MPILLLSTTLLDVSVSADPLDELDPLDEFDPLDELFLHDEIMGPRSKISEIIKIDL